MHDLFKSGAWYPNDEARFGSCGACNRLIKPKEFDEVRQLPGQPDQKVFRRLVSNSLCLD